MPRGIYYIVENYLVLISLMRGMICKRDAEVASCP